MVDFILSLYVFVFTLCFLAILMIEQSDKPKSIKPLQPKPLRRSHRRYIGWFD